MWAPLLLAVASLDRCGPDFPTQPMVVVDPGRHVDPAYASADAKGKWLVTGTWDSEIRVWLYPEFRLFRTIRLPLAPNYDGSLGPPDLSGDGRTIVVGTIRPSAWNGTKDKPGHAFYVIDRATGKVLARQAGFKSSVAMPAVSHDGSRIAVCTVRDSGPGFSLKIYSWDKGLKVVKSLDTFEGAIYGLDFDPSGKKLAVACDDGTVSLFSRDGERIASIRYSPRAAARTTRFSPDGQRLVVFADAPRAPGQSDAKVRGPDIFSAKDLSYLGTASNAGKASGDFVIPAWSFKGDSLAAGMTARDSQGRYIVRVWSKGGLGPWKDAHFDSYTGCVSGLPDGFLVTCQDTSVWKVGADGSKTCLQQATMFTVPFVRFPEEPQRGVERLLQADPSGARVSMPLDGTRDRLSFDVPRRQARIDDSRQVSQDEGLPVASTEKIKIEVRPRVGPFLNGKPLSRTHGSPINCWTVLPKDEGFVFGGLWYLERYAPDGVLVWRTRIPLECFGANVSDDGRIIVAAMRDHTLRWYRARDGRELLALFVDKTTMDWVLWTPEGYYDCSPLAESFLRWQVNTAPDAAATVCPIGRYRSIYFRPDVIDRVLAETDVSSALSQADTVLYGSARGSTGDEVAADLPPAIVISEVVASPTSQGNSVRVVASVTPVADRAVEWVEIRTDDIRRVRVDVSKADGSAVIKLDKTFTVETVPHTVQIKVWASNKGTVEEVPVREPNRGDPAVRPNVGGLAGAFRPKRVFLLAIGVNEYQNRSGSNLSKLLYAEDDALSFRAELESQRVEGTVIISKTLIGPEVTYKNTSDALKAIRTQAPGASDAIVIFFAGHGLILNPSNRQNKYVFPMVDYDPNDPDTYFSSLDFERWVDSTSGCLRVLFLDTCHANAFATNLAVFDNSLGLGVFAACPAGGSARESQGSISGDLVKGHGNFTRGLLEGLRGGDNQRAFSQSYQCVTLSGLQNFLFDYMPSNHAQRPVINLNEGTELMAIGRGKKRD